MKLFVAGATGTVGGHLVAQLVEAGHQVRALTRNPEAQFPAGVEVVVGNLSNPSSFAAALEGVEGMHLINFDGTDYGSLQSGAEIVALAEQAGVKRVTVLRGGDPKASLENALEASSLAWTYLQPVEFMSNVFDWAESICADNEVRQGYVNRKSAIVHEADIAAVAAGALTNDGHGGQSYSITGGEVLTPVQMIAIINQVLDRDVRLVELTEAQARDQWSAAGFTDDVIEFFVWAYGNTPPEGYTVVPTVEQVTGKPPRSFAQWVDENRARFC